MPDTKSKAREEVCMDEHLVSICELESRYKLSNVSMGLCQESIESRQARDGKNVLTPPRKSPVIVLLMKELTHGFALLLWFGAGLCVVAYLLDPLKDVNNLFLGGALAAAVSLTGVYGFWQNFRSSKALEALKTLTAPSARVRRDGEVFRVPASEVCLGDVVLLMAGERVPADLRLVETSQLKVEQAALTGESEEVSKRPLSQEEVSQSSAKVLEAENLAFAGTMVVNGTGVGIAVKIGDETVVGRIAALVNKTADEKTTLQIEISHFVKVISIVAVCISVSFAILGIVFSQSSDWHTRIITNLVFAISLIVANVPEGLLTTVTISVVFSALALKAKGVLVKNLSTVETLGACSCICSDKTGTITENRMTLAHIALPDGTLITAPPAADGLLYYDRLIQCAVLCNEAEVSLSSSIVGGNASDQGLLRFVEEHHPGRIKKLRLEYPLIAREPFNSKVKCATVTCGNREIFIKGAPEAVLARCTHSASEPLDDMRLSAIMKSNNEFAKNGERVLAFAHQSSESKTEFLGLVSLRDPPRQGVREAVAKCRTAGIKVIMVTGDQPLTAEAIAKEVGIIDKSYKVIEMGRMSEEELEAVLNTEDLDLVFARTTPTEKLRIAECLKRLGKIIAMTGDGVNDAPALKAAHVGVAMGVAGTEVAKEAADIILTNDDFSAIVKGIEQGRLIYDNLKKSIAYTLTSNIPELFPYLFSVILGIPLPLTTPLILCVDLGADIIPAISFAYERPELDIMQRKPRDSAKDKMVNKKLIFFSYALVGMVQALAGFATYFQVMRDFGFSPSGLVGLNDLKFINSDRQLTTLNWLTNTHGQLKLCGRTGHNCDGPIFTLQAFHEHCCRALQGSCPENSALQDPHLGHLGGVLYKENLKGEIECPADRRLNDGIYWPPGVLTAESQKKIDSATQATDCRYTDLVSPISKTSVCYTTEAVKYAQTSFFVTIVFVQYATLFFCKVRILSLVHQGGFSNKVMLLGVLVETLIALAVTYLPFAHTAFNTRPLQPWHFGVGAMPFAVFNLLFDETRKFFMRCAGFGLPNNRKKNDWKSRFGSFLYRYTYY